MSRVLLLSLGLLLGIVLSCSGSKEGPPGAASDAATESGPDAATVTTAGGP